jgi:gas vesicle protein
VSDDMRSWRSSILVSFVAGGLTGAAVALLLAPQSGQGTRSLINQRIRDGVDRARKTRQRIARQGREVQEGASSHLGGQRGDF